MVINRPTKDDILDARERWMRDLARDEKATAQRLVEAYSRITRNGGVITRSMDALVQRIVEAGKPSPQDVRRLKEYQDLLFNVQTEMNGFSVIYKNEAASLTTKAAQLGVEAAQSMVVANAPLASGEIIAGWNLPNQNALTHLIWTIDNETWVERQNAFGERAAEAIGDTILGLVAQGKNPRFIAEAISTALAVPFSWADNTVKTAQIYAYRTSNHLAYASNPQFVTGWVWQSALDKRTCMSCVAQHGNFFEVDRILNDHHRGRCTPLPVVKGTKWHSRMKTGEEWFNSLSEIEQRKQVGNNELYEAYKRGEFKFSEFSMPYEDKVYGEMLTQASYQKIRLGATSNSIKPISQWKTYDDAVGYLKQKHNISLLIEGDIVEIETLREMTNELDSLTKKFPEVSKRLEKIEFFYMPGDRSKNTLADADTTTGRTIRFNNRHNKSWLNKQTPDLGGWSVTDHTQIRATFTHEYGHMVDSWLGTKTGYSVTPYLSKDGFGDVAKTRNRVVQAWMKTLKPEDLSKYGMTNTRETFAESFTAWRFIPAGKRSEHIQRFDYLMEFLKVETPEEWIVGYDNMIFGEMPDDVYQESLKIKKKLGWIE